MARQRPFVSARVIPFADPKRPKLPHTSGLLGLVREVFEIGSEWGETRTVACRRFINRQLRGVADLHPHSHGLATTVDQAQFRLRVRAVVEKLAGHGQQRRASPPDFVRAATGIPSPNR
jgi:hypothetical protein